MPTRQLAVGLTPIETRRPIILHLADRAEALGYDAFFVAEGWGHDAGVLLGEIATRTHRITLGTGILNVWGRTAASIAMLAASLAEVSSDRFVLGLGAGSPPLAEGLHDVDFTAPVQRLDAVTRQARRLLSGQRLEATVQRDNRPLKLAVTPQKAIPIHMAALGPHAVRLAGELADGWVPFLLPLSGLDSSSGCLRKVRREASPGVRLRSSHPASPQRHDERPALTPSPREDRSILLARRYGAAPPLDEFMPAGRTSVLGVAPYHQCHKSKATLTWTAGTN